MLEESERHIADANRRLLKQVEKGARLTHGLPMMAITILPDKSAFSYFSFFLY